MSATIETYFAPNKTVRELDDMVKSGTAVDPLKEFSEAAREELFRWEGGVGGHDLLGDALKPGRHTIVFDFKYDGLGPGKGGTGVFTVDGKELARKTMKHTIPLLMSIDETFDVGIDTRTAVDNDYQVPFRFTGTIDKLTVKLGPSQLSPADQKAADTAIRNVNN